MDETTPLTPSGRRLAGRYVLHGLLGQGGMAAVELAYDEKLDRQVAVKILHGRYADDPAFLGRFRREAQAAASLNHPNIVAVYDTGEDGGRPFIVMEHVAGRSLQDVLRREGVLPHRAAEIAAAAAAALHEAHERGLVHRDIKPGNILIADDGTVKVTDFGIARAVNAETVTQTAAVFGTAAYVAPEQARGGAVDRRTDVYALGCVLYEMLTGRQPFAGESAVAVAYQHISEEPVHPRRLNPEVSPQLEAVTLKAMAKDPSSRYASAQDMRADLERALRGMAVVAPPAGAAAAATTELIDRTMVAPVPPGERERVVVQRRRGGAARMFGYTLLALLVLALFIVAGVLLANLFRTETVALVTVPNVEGQPLDQAQSALAAEGFEVELAEPVEDPAVPPNHVISTDPPPLAQAREGSTVLVTYSAGAPLVQVPAVEGRTEDEARQALVDAQLGIGERREQPSDEVEAGRVITADPPSGSEVEAGTPIALVIASGPATVAVPNVENFPEADARQTLEAACEPRPCFAVSTPTTEYSDRVAEGRVLRQDPAPGTRVAPGSPVRLVLSRGPEPEPSPTPTRPSPSPTQSPSPTASPSPTETVLPTPP